MEHRHPQSLPQAKVPAEDRRHHHRSQQFDAQCGNDDERRQTNNSADFRGGHRILHGAALHQPQLPARQHGDGGRYGHHTQSADLNEQQDHALSEYRPVGSRVLDHQPRYTHGGGGSEQRIHKGGHYPGYTGYGEHQKQRSHQDDSCKAKCGNLERIQLQLSLSQLQCHICQLLSRFT